MALREARVLEVRDGLLRLQLQGDACSGCSSGCGGRCQLFRASECLELPQLPGRAMVPDPMVGDVLSLSVDDAQLRRAAWQGYGRALVGLVAGASLGHAIGRGLDGPENLLALVGMTLGTLAATCFSKPPSAPALGLAHRGIADRGTSSLLESKKK